MTMERSKSPQIHTKLTIIQKILSIMMISVILLQEMLKIFSFYSISYSIINEIQNRNDMVFIFRHDNKDLSNDDVYKFASGMKYFLTEIPVSMTLGEAYKELQNFFSQKH